MKLLLTSNGFSHDSIVSALEELAGKKVESLSLAFIPTASSFSDENKDWLIDDLWRCKELGFKYIDIVEIAALKKEGWLSRLAKADVVLVGGGENEHLYRHMSKSGLAEILADLMQDKVYVGISAGAMIVGPDVDDEISLKFFDEKKCGALDMVDFWIKPHLYGDFYPERTLEAMTDKLEGVPHDTYLLDDYSAVLVDGQDIKIVNGERSHLIKAV